jgi:hypothetical protein
MRAELLEGAVLGIEATTDQRDQVVSPRDRPTAPALFAKVALPLFILYLLTASWTLPYHIDAASNVFTAWELAKDGDVLLDRYDGLSLADLHTVAWVVPAGDSVATQYPPGAAALAVPLYAVWPYGPDQAVLYRPGTNHPTTEIAMPPLGPAAITAALVSAIAVGLFALILRRLTDDRSAVMAAYVAGLGTGVWSVASDSLWQHGPAMLWITAGILLSVQRRLWSGFAFGAAVITRPHTALIAAGNGLYQSWREKSFKPALLIGFGAMVGLVGLVVFNAAVFGSPSLSGGYSPLFAARATSLNLLTWGRNVVLAMVDPQRGLLLYSPFLILLIPGLPAAWRKAPGWVQGSALGGLLYLLLQLKANRYSGGLGFWGYRYPLECLAAAAPLLFLSYSEWIRGHASDLVRRLFRYTVIASVLITLLGAVAY